VQKLCRNADIGDTNDSFPRRRSRAFRGLIAEVIENPVGSGRGARRIRLTDSPAILLKVPLIAGIGIEGKNCGGGAYDVESPAFGFHEAPEIN
jgi:hypothetical protein